MNGSAPRKRHVLIVEDELDVAHALKALLEERDYEVSTVPNGVLALKQILLKEVDAILCDLKMPQLEGDMFYAAVKRVKPQLGERFIFITGMADDPKFQSFLSSIALPVLQKPVTGEQLMTELDGLLGPRT